LFYKVSGLLPIRHFEHKGTVIMHLD